ncbi:MAG TPA: hypothetical protein VGX76_17060, partial [Pirellulales bacterium]|nr:hypothetical protein [Pirellulales bacterium]
LTGTGQVLGTPSYMPPEQAGAKLDQIGPTSDVYSIGAVLYCLLTGRPPFQAASPMDTLLQVLGREPVAPRLLNSKLPRDLQTICLKCLRKETAKRYPTAATLAADLGRWLDGKPIVARPVGRGERAWLCCKRRPAVAALSAAIVIISMVGSWVAVERQNAVYAEGLVDSLVKADIGQVRGLMRQMGEYARWAQPMIRERFAQANDDSREKLRLSLVLVASGERHVDDLFEPLLVADAKTFPVIRDVLAERKAAITDRLWAVLRGRDSDPQQRRLRAAGALAEYDPLNAQWAEVAQEVAGQLVTVKALFLGQWQQALRPVADRLAPHLAEIFTDPEQGELPRSLAKSLLVDFSKDDPRTLTRLIVDADPTAFGELFPVLQSHQSRAIEELVAVLDRTVEPTWNDPPLDPLWREVPDEARLAIDAAHGLLAERFAFCQDLPWSDFQQLAESLRHCGYRPVRVRPWHGNGRLLGEDKQGRDVELLVAAIWTRDGELWELETNLAPDQLPQAGEPAEKNGLVPIDIAVLPAAQGGADHRFVLLWGEPTAADERRQIVIDSSEHEIEAV